MKNIQKDLKTGNLKKMYLLYGEEAYLKQQYKQGILKALEVSAEDMNFSRFEGKHMDVREIISLCETMPFFAEHRVILIENSGFFKNKCEELADYLKTLPDYVRLIFVETEVDKRSRMYKILKAEGGIGEFAFQNEKTLMRWAAGYFGNEGKKITQQDLELFLSKTGTNMGMISMELQKLVAYTMGREVITAQDIEAVCATQITNKIFEMVRAVAERNQKKALDLYYDLLTLREPPMRILFLLARQFRQLLLTKKYAEEGLQQAEIAARLGVQAFVARGLLLCARSYEIEELEEAMRDFAELEEAVKTGNLGDTLSVELVIMKYSAERQHQ